MADPFRTGVDTHFIGDDSDWRNELTDEDPDDEELESTPMDVVGMLGFDPKQGS